MSPPDRHVRRSGDDYAEALSGLLPTGPAWPRDPDAALMQLVSGLAQIWGLVDGRAADLLEIETDPRLTYQLLPDWERAFGLPELVALFDTVETYKPFSFGPSSFGGSRGRIEPPAIRYSTVVTSYKTPALLSLPERRNALVNKLTAEGGQSRDFFYSVAAQLGYEIEIREFRPFQFGLSSFGGSRGQIQPPSVSFFWSVSVHGARVTRFQFGASSFGRDPILRLHRAEDLESVVRRWKPAHTEVIFHYDDHPPVEVVRFQFGASSFGHDPILTFAS